MDFGNDDGLPQGPVSSSSGVDPDVQRALDEARKRMQLRGDHEDDTAMMQSPVVGFWQRLRHGVAPKDAGFMETALTRTKEIGRSVARGAANLVEEAARNGDGYANDQQAFHQRVVADIKAANPDVAMPEGAPQVPAHNAATVAHVKDRLLGKRSEDPIAGFAEDATQFAIAFAATDGIGSVVETGVAKAGARTVVQHMASSAVRGAVVDAGAFDPHQAGLAELAARSGLPGLRQLGEALSVGEDDSAIVARLKRGAAGIIPGVALDALIHGTKLAWARTVLRNADAPAAQKTLAHSVEAESEKVMQDIADGTHTPEGALVVARPTEQGTWELRPVAEETPQAGEKAASEFPEFKDRGEAEAQAETINMAHREMVQAVKDAPEVSPEALEEFRGVFRDLAQAHSADALKDVIDRSRTVFSINLEEPTERTMAAARSIAKVWESEVIAKKMTVPQMKAQAHRLLGGLTDEEAVGSMTRLVAEKSGEGREILSLASDYVLSLASDKVGRLHDIVEARPHDPVANEMLRKAVGKMLDLQRAVMQEDSRWGRQGRLIQERAGFRQEMANKSPFKAPEVPAGEVVPAYPPIEGLTMREIREIARVTKMGGGVPRNLYHVTKAVGIIREGGNLRAFSEYFINNILSAPATALVQATMNGTMTVLRPAMRALGGAVRGDTATIREAADMLYADIRYLRENLVAAGKAWKAGSSQINPAPVRVAIGGHVAEDGAALSLAQKAENAFGTAVRLPTRNILAIDEFFKVTNYRAWVRAQSLKQWRAKSATWAAAGMSEKEIEQAISRNVERDLKGAFDEHGIGVYEGGAKYADEITFQTPLGDNTIGGGIHALVNKYPLLKMIAPFVKTSINLFRWNWQHTPLLNQFNAQAKEIMARGGADAAELHATTALVTTMYAYAGYAFHQGDVTGRAPTDPNLRALWYKAGNTPYTLTVRNPWTDEVVAKFNYRRGDPIFMPMALVADAWTAANELHDSSERGKADAEQILTGSLAGLAATLSNRSYLYSTSQFFEAWGRGDVTAMQAWTGALAQGTVLEGSMLTAVNNDPYLREAHGIVDRTLSRLPGWGKDFSPRYDLTGNPVLKSAGYQPLDPFPEQPNAKANDVAQALLELKKGFSALPNNRIFLNGMQARVDLTDRTAFAEGAKHPDTSPWDRLNELLRSPGDGRAGLEDKLRELIKSNGWQQATDGTAMFPGGTRWLLAAHVIDAYQQAAAAKVLQEYPKLAQEVQRQTIEKVAAPGGEQNVFDALQRVRR